jgi:riboflavin biosynthesis pyrimidine reductase/pyrimidine deaminase RibD-like protein
VPERPYVLVSCAMSVDGRIDDEGSQRLMLSGEADLDRVDELRAGCDAILVGANTVRRDNPRLLVRSARRRAKRVAAGRPAHPRRVTITASGDLDPSARFFAPQDPGTDTAPSPEAGHAPDAARMPEAGASGMPLVYCASPAVAATAARLGKRAEVIDAGDPLSVPFVLRDLAAERGVARLVLEGGSRTLRCVLAAGLADELHLAIAPFFVGEATAPSFGLPGTYPHGPGNPMTLAGVRRVGGMVALRYLLGPGGADRRFLRAAIELSRQCPPSRTAFSVGAIVVAADGEVMATGYSREQQPHDHAEEVALRKVGPADPRLAGATIYSSLVPCGARASRPRTCVQHIIASRIRRVVYAWREPPIFTEGRGAGQLRDAGITVVEIPDLAEAASAVNAHLLPRGGAPRGPAPP